ncbi:MAG: TonB-dependent receptor [Chloracidobacterium sp.]|nr:TonB-dependent receptor [Chloracidobacterium sp.]
MSNTIKTIFSVLFVFVLASAIAYGQSVSGALEGTVMDDKGAVVPGATVTATGVNTAFNQSVVADSNGMYRFPRLPAGLYSVKVAPIKGFAEKTVSTSVVSEKTTTADFSLSIGVATVDVQVDADPLGKVVDSSDSKVQTVVTSRLMEKLPTGTSFNSILTASPSVRSESLTGGFQVDGASKAENAWIIDGQDVTNHRYGTQGRNEGANTNNIPIALVKEVQIKTSGFEAEHGGASGAVIVVATKSGTNALHGEFGAQFRPSNLQSDPRLIDQNSYYFTGSQTAPQGIFKLPRPPLDDSLNFDPTASLGGPIIKNHLWFYGIYSPQISNARRTTKFYNFSSATNTIVPNPTYSDEVYDVENRYEYVMGRLDYSIFNNLTGFTSFLWNPLIVNGAFPFGAQAIDVNGNPGQLGYALRGPDLYRLKGGRNNSNVFNTQLAWNPASWFILSGRYGHGFENAKTDGYAANDTSPTRYICQGTNGSLPYTQGATGCSFGFQNTASNVGFNNGEVSKRNTYNLDSGFFFNGLGRHHLKVGYEYQKTAVLLDRKNFHNTQLFYGRNPNNFASNIDGSCWFDGDPSTNNGPNECIGYGVTTRYEESGGAASTSHAIYFQDKWTIGRLTLNLGVRTETENLPAFGSLGGAGTLTGDAITIPFARKTVPRMGASYDLFGNGKARIFGSWGIFSDRMKFESPIGSFGGSFYTRDYYPILAQNPLYTYYTDAVVLGGWDYYRHGHGDPSTLGGLSQTHFDFRPPSNITPEQALKIFGYELYGVDPKLKPFKQQEFSAGFETELWKDYVFSARYIRKNVLTTIEDIGYFWDAFYIQGNPGEGKAKEQAEALGVDYMQKPERVYNGLQFEFTRRFSKKYFYSTNYTWSRLFGNYAGLAASEYWDGGATNGSSATRSSPGVNRYWDWTIAGYTSEGKPDNGLLPTDRTHVFRASGGYTLDWFNRGTNETQFSFTQVIQSGTPQTTSVGAVAGHSFSIVFKERGDLGRTPTFSKTDFYVSHAYKFGRDGRFKLVGDITFSNLFNQSAVTSIDPRRWLYLTEVQEGALETAATAAGFLDGSETYEEYTIGMERFIISGQAAGLYEALDGLSNNRNALYGKPSSYQAPRGIRFGFRFVF